MIALIVGRCADDDGTALVIETDSGVGYCVQVGDRDRAAIKLRERVTLHCRTIFRENDQAVFGFLDRNDKTAFDKMIKLQGLGPSTALRVLSAMGAQKLALVVSAGDVKELRKIPGIGPKSAQSLIEELKL